MNRMTIRTYSELVQLPTFKERFKYLSLDGTVGRETFGYDRYINQKFYKSPEWKRLRDFLIVRDNGCDLALDGFEIFGKILIHHLNPITKNDILNQTEFLMNPEYLVCTTFDTHNAIHYGDEKILLEKSPIERSPNDTCPWKNN